MELSQLEQFLMIAKYQNINRAAVELSISQPALSQSLVRIEQELSLKLFDREGKKIVINENGKMFAGYARNILNQMESFNLEINKKKSNYLNITAEDGYFQSFILPYWFISADNARVFTQQFDPNSIVQQLRNDSIDIAVCNSPIDKSGITCDLLMKSDTFVCLPCSNPLAEKHNLSVSDLKDQIFIRMIPEINQDPMRSKMIRKITPNVNTVFCDDYDAWHIICKRSDYLYFTCTYRLLDFDIPKTRKLIIFEDGQYSWPVYLCYKEKSGNPNVERFVLWAQELVNHLINQHSILGKSEVD